jgi:hypothetical protein
VSEGPPPAEELARAERAGWAAVRAAGLDEGDDGHLWQAVFYAAQRETLAPPTPSGGLDGRPSG